MANKVLLVMQRKLLSDALIARAASDLRFSLIAEGNYASAALTAEATSPAIILVEIPESGPWKAAEKCLALCDVMRARQVDCKPVILCSENDETACRAAIQAKQARRIDDFVFYDNSVHYLFSKLEALLEQPTQQK
ncbi:MAG: hypothetical protein FWF10_11190 [Clostridiales bacterium]|nr:hypothetical protein [Clostridiales bacterium]